MKKKMVQKKIHGKKQYCCEENSQEEIK